MARKKSSNTLIEDNPDLKKLYLFVTIVNQGQGDNILKLYQMCGSSAQFVQLGRGTAQKQIADILGLEDNRKEILYAFVTKDDIPELKKELEAYFVANKKNKGIGFSIPLTSVIGAKLYHFLANTL